MITRWIYLGAVFLLLSSLCQAQEACSAEPNKSLLSIDALKAAKVALDQFEKDQPTADQKHFRVSVEEFEDYFKIHFSPDFGPLEQGVDGDMAYIVIPNPRKSKYGLAVGYYVDKSSGKILRTVYSK